VAIVTQKKRRGYQSKARKPKTVLRLLDLEHSKSAVFGTETIVQPKGGGAVSNTFGAEETRTIDDQCPACCRPAVGL
jgi:hypothetical protein